MSNFNMNNFVNELFGANNKKISKDDTNTPKKDNHRLIIQNKLKLAGWAGYKIVGYMICTNVYKVKLDDGTLITMEKDGAVMHVYQNKRNK